MVGEPPAELLIIQGVQGLLGRRTDHSSRGLVMAAGVHGEPDIATYAEAMASFGDTTEPDPEKYELYGEVAEIQSKIYPALKGVTADIHAFMQRHPG